MLHTPTSTRTRLAIAVLVWLQLSAPLAAVRRPCRSLGGPAPGDVVRAAHVIVRARAEAQATTRQGVRFSVLAVLKGAMNESGNPLEIAGSLTDADEFNEHPVPYPVVRSSGRSRCFARSYKTGAEYLLMLRRADEGFSAEWFVLAPVNEQIRGDRDPWLLWVRTQVAPQ
jgi:hypothetical protein